jgi:outer membrane receptor protein involved in Fe transport
VQRRARGSEDLEPEQSTNTSIGVVWDITDNLFVTLDYWSIEKEDTIGLFGEENHTLFDLLLRLEAGVSNCASVGNPAVGRVAATTEEAAAFLAAGICPAGIIEYIDDNYANLDTRTVEGHDIGVYWDIDTGIGDFSFKYVGTFYDKYEQTPGGPAQELVDAQMAGIIPSNYPIAGFEDLIGKGGNQDKKMNATLSWRKGDFGAQTTWLYLGSFYDPDLTLADGRRYVIPSMDTWNLSFDWSFDAFNTRSRLRLGVNNVTDERAPLADGYFGYFEDAHRDLGRSWYLDLRVRFGR